MTGGHTRGRLHYNCSLHCFYTASSGPYRNCNELAVVRVPLEYMGMGNQLFLLLLSIVCLLDTSLDVLLVVFSILL